MSLPPLLPLYPPDPKKEGRGYTNYLLGFICLFTFLTVVLLSVMAVIMGLLLQKGITFMDSVEQIDFEQWNRHGLVLMTEPLDTIVGQGTQRQAQNLMYSFNNVFGETASQMNSSQVMTRLISTLQTGMKTLNLTLDFIDKVVPLMGPLLPQLVDNFKHLMSSTNETLAIADDMVPQFVDAVSGFMDTIKQVNTKLQAMFGGTSSLTTPAVPP